MPRPVLGESCTTSIKDFAIFPPHQKKKKINKKISIFNFQFIISDPKNLRVQDCKLKQSHNDALWALHHIPTYRVEKKLSGACVWGNPKLLFDHIFSQHHFTIVKTLNYAGSPGITTFLTIFDRGVLQIIRDIGTFCLVFYDILLFIIWVIWLYILYIIIYYILYELLQKLLLETVEMWHSLLREEAHFEQLL